MTETAHALPVTVHRESYVALHELVVRREDEQVIAGRVATETFVALPEIGGHALEVFAAERSVADAEAVLAARTGAPVDLVEFVESLVELGFVRSVDGRPVGAEEPRSASLPWLRPRHCAWLFGLPATIAFMALVVAAIATVVVGPSRLVPHSSDFFWSSHLSLVIAGNTGMVLAALALHELAHLAAARSLGVNARFTLGTRLQNLVAQTDVTGLWALPRRRRYRAYLAGMASDLALLSGAVLALGHLTLPDTVRAVLSALVLLLMLALARQFQLFMRTDVYFVLADLLGAKNLMEDAAAYVGSQARRLTGLLRSPHRLAPVADVLRSLPQRERRNVRIYAPVMVVGCTVSLTVALVYGLPIILGFYARGIDAVVTGAARGDVARALDGAVGVGVPGTLQALFVVVLVRGRAARTRAVLRRLRTTG